MIEQHWQTNLKHYRNINFDFEAQSFAQLKDSANGRAAICVGAGPSLDNNIHLLKNLDPNKFCIISVITIIPSFIKLGIEPDYIQLSEETENVCMAMDGHNFKNTSLIRTSTANPSEPENWTGESFFFNNMTSKIAFRAKQAKFPNIPNLDPISHNGGFHCIEFAVYMGFENICFVGLDLCLTGKRHHAKGIDYKMFGTDLDNNPKKWLAMENSYKSSLNLVKTYAAKRKHKKIINCSQGGAITEFPMMDLSAWIEAIHEGA